MKQSWISGLEKDAVGEIKSHFLSSLILRKRLVDMLRSKEEEAVKSGRSKSGYDCPNWAFKQADLAGYTRAINEVISLIEK